MSIESAVGVWANVSIAHKYSLFLEKGLDF